jgi:hypothetical protein
LARKKVTFEYQSPRRPILSRCCFSSGSLGVCRNRPGIFPTGVGRAFTGFPKRSSIDRGRPGATSQLYLSQSAILRLEALGSEAWPQPLLQPLLSWDSLTCAPLPSVPRTSTPEPHCCSPSARRCQATRMFHPRGFSPPRRLAPCAMCQFVAPGSRQGFAAQSSVHTLPKHRVPERLRDAHPEIPLKPPVSLHPRTRATGASKLTLYPSRSTRGQRSVVALLPHQALATRTSKLTQSPTFNVTQPTGGKQSLLAAYRLPNPQSVTQRRSAT